jgi:hypothetical protein
MMEGTLGYGLLYVPGSYFLAAAVPDGPVNIKPIGLVAEA